MAANVISTAEAEAHFRLSPGEDTPGVEAAVEAAQQRLESLLGFRVVDATVVARVGTPSDVDEVVALPIPYVRAARLVRGDETDTASSVERYSARQDATVVRPPAGGWTVLTEGDEEEPYWSIDVGASAIKPVWKQACLMLATSYYFDRLGEMTVKTQNAVMTMLSDESLRRRRASGRGAAV